MLSAKFLSLFLPFLSAAKSAGLPRPTVEAPLGMPVLLRETDVGWTGILPFLPFVKERVLPHECKKE